MFTLDGSVLRLETRTQSVVLENGLITSLRSKATGREYVSCKGGDVPLIAHWRGCMGNAWPESERRPMDKGEIAVRLLSDTRAEVLFHSWYGDGVLLLWEDAETGDLCVRPSVSSGRPGVKAAGWELRGISDELYAVVPTSQGVRLKLSDPLLAGERLGWPQSWEIGLCVFESDEGDGFWVHTRDNRYIYKDLHIGKDDRAGSIELLTEAYGPLDENLSAGGLVWRVNCFEGGWRVPAAIYRRWYFDAYRLDAQRANRQPWLRDIRMALCWQGTNTAMLDELAKQVDPRKTLIHLAIWRDAKYDQEYPDYWPSKDAAAYIRYGESLGFRIAPHMNSEEIDPSHAVYPLLSPFQMQSVDDRTVYGWAFKAEDWSFPGVPWTEYAKRDPCNRDYNIMTKIHPGSSLWQHELYTRMEKLASEYPVAGCFIDVSLCTYNLHNALVEGRTSTEGMNDLIRLLSGIRGGLPIGGEGLNEITAQGESFAQMHLYHSGHFSCPGLERCGGDCAINDFIYGDLCFTIGYANVSGKNDDELTRARVYDDHNTIPTLTCTAPEQIAQPNAYVRSVMEKAR